MPQKYCIYCVALHPIAFIAGNYARKKSKYFWIGEGQIRKTCHILAINFEMIGPLLFDFFLTQKETRLVPGKKSSSH